MKKNKKKLIKAFEDYVNSLSDTDMKDFNINVKGGLKFNFDDSKDSSDFYFEIGSASVGFVEEPIGINRTAFMNVEKELYGKTIPMEYAKDWCEIELNKRSESRDENSTPLAQSVYFSYENISKWIVSVLDEYPNTPMVGFRVYFAGYPSVLPTDIEIDSRYADKSTVVLRAMYFKENEDKKSGSILKIPLDSNNSKKDILTFNLGGLCPPRCQNPNIE